jgi:hypothetical protein
MLAGVTTYNLPLSIALGSRFYIRLQLGMMPAPSRLSYLRELEEACTQQWLLSTSELADLLGLTPGTITDYGEEFSDAGFTFTRAGKRKGGEIAWRIGKPKRSK